MGGGGNKIKYHGIKRRGWPKADVQQKPTTDISTYACLKIRT